MKLDGNELKHMAQSNWYEIHTRLGIDPKLLNGKHQPCPFCGGKDRFRYTNYQESGSYICNQCTPKGGNGFHLIMMMFNCSFRESLKMVAETLGVARPEPSKNTGMRPIITKSPSRATTQAKQDHQAKLSRLWEQSQPLNGTDPASLYLISRGLNLTEQDFAKLNNLRFGMVEYWTPSTQDQPLLLGTYPCMIGAITNPTGELQGLHQTFLQPIPEDASKWQKLALLHPQLPDEEPLTPKKMKSRFSGSLKGAAVHLFKPNAQGALMVAEGIETALAAYLLFDMPCVAALSCYGMENFRLPDGVKEVFIVGDNDRAGKRGVDKLTLNIFKEKEKPTVSFWFPPEHGFDALDYLNYCQSIFKEIKGVG